MSKIPFLSVIVTLFLLCGPPLGAETAPPAPIPLFNNRFLIETEGNTASPDIVLFVPHSNEKNGAAAAGEVLKGWKKAGLYMLHPCNGEVEEAMKKDGVPCNDPAGRYLFFSVKERWYALDPNRIYTMRGIGREILTYQSPQWVTMADRPQSPGIPQEMKDTIADGAAKILNALHIGGKGPRPAAVVAVHNNSPTAPGNLDTFSFLWYSGRGPCAGEVEQKEGKPCMYQGDPAHIDNLILVNSHEDFLYIKNDGRFNVLLMKSQAEGVQGDDGSLSVYCSSRNIRYINVEAQHMNSPRENDLSREYQAAMLRLIRKMLHAKAEMK